MSVVVVTPPSVLPVSLDEARRFLRIDGGDEDDVLQALILAATAKLDGPDGWLGRSLCEQVLELRLMGFPAYPVELRYGPVIDIVGVTYWDEAGVTQTVDPAVYRILDGHLALACGQSWPSSRYVRVRYRAGYVGNAIPAPIKTAILLYVRQLRGDDGEAGMTSGLSETVIELLRQYRFWF